MEELFYQLLFVCVCVCDFLCQYENGNDGGLEVTTAKLGLLRAYGRCMGQQVGGYTKFGHTYSLEKHSR